VIVGQVDGVVSDEAVIGEVVDGLVEVLIASRSCSNLIGADHRSKDR